MRTILLWLLLVVLLFAPIVQGASFEREDSVEEDGVYAKNDARGEVDVQVDTEVPVIFYAEAGNEAGFNPQQSSLDPSFDAAQALWAELLAFVPETPTVTVPEQAAASDAVPSEIDVPETADQESEGVFNEGASVGTRSTASNDAITTEARAQAGHHSTSHSSETRMDEGLPVAHPMGHGWAAKEEPAAEPAPAEEPQTGAAGAGPAAVAMGFSSIVSGSVDPVAAAIATATVVIGSTGAAVFVVPGWRTAVWKLLRRFGGLLLFSRIAQSEILNHQRRSYLLEFVKQNPGERVEVARRALGFSNGSMHYHLRVLQGRDLLRIHKIGGCARLFVAGPRVQPAPYVPARRRKFLEIVSATPGLTQREVAAALGLSERMVSYHVRTLHSQGLLDIQADGFRKRLFLKSGQTTPATA